MNIQPIARKLIGGGGELCSHEYMNVSPPAISVLGCVCFCIHVKVAIENKFIL